MQRKRVYCKRLAKYLSLSLLFTPVIFRCVVAFMKKIGIDYDAVIHNLSKSFPSEGFFAKIRVQPSYPLLKLMLRRFKTSSWRSLPERIHRGDYLLKKLPETCLFPGTVSEKHTYWVFPILHDHPDDLIKNLRNSGFDATRKHSLEIIEPSKDNPGNTLPDCRRIVQHILYLPFYRQIPMNEVDRMIEKIKSAG